MKHLVCFHLSEQRTLDEDCLTELAVHYGTGRAQIEALVSKVSMLWTYTEEAALTEFFQQICSRVKPHTLSCSFLHSRFEWLSHHSVQLCEIRYSALSGYLLISLAFRVCKTTHQMTDFLMERILECRF